MAEAAFDFRVMDPEQRKGGGTLDLSYWTYKVRARTTLANYPRKEMEVLRRYSDFDWLRSALAEEYPFCIIPPTPEKAVQGTIDKLVGSATNTRLLEYRQRALRKFLIRVGAHPHLYTSQLLQDFLEMDESEWERRMKAPKRPNAAERSIAAAVGETVGTALSRQWYPSGGAGTGAAAGASAAAATSGGAAAAAGGPTGGQAYTKAVTSVGALPPQAVWEETRAYVGQLEASINLLRDRLEQLVRRRRDTSSALHEFGRAFTRVGEIEASIEPSGLSNALVAVGQHSDQLSAVFLEQADAETKQVVETLNYYVGMCQAVREALKRLLNYMAARDSAAAQVADLTSQLDRAVGRGGGGGGAQSAEKVAKIEGELAAAKAKSELASRQLASVEQLFREELRRFHREKQYDVKAILKIFADLQLDYAAKMKHKWETLLPVVEQAKV